MKLKHIAHAISLIGFVGSFASIAYADDASDTTESAKKVEKIEVTGSRIQRTTTETPSPVQVITHDDLVKSGVTSASEALREITANGQGTLSQSFSQAFASGGSGIALRGLTVGATLVLVDGHRLAPYPLSDDGERSFVDISAIPFDAIERIEVLKDGASATYGSDAMAGVVNVILKKNYTGSKITAETGTSYKHDGNTSHVAGIMGWGDIDSDGQSGYLSMEYRKQDPIQLTNRPNINTPNWNSQGGNNLTLGAGNNPLIPNPVLPTAYFLNPGSTGPTQAFMPGCSASALAANQCTYQPWWSQIQPKTENINILGKYNRNLGGDWNLSLAASMFESKDTIQVTPFFTNGTPNFGIGIAPGPQVNVYNYTLTAPLPANLASQFGVAAGTPANLVYLFNDLGAQTNAMDSKTYRVAADVTGTWNGWDLQFALGGSRIVSLSTLTGTPNLINLQNALNNGTYQLGVNNSSSVISQVAPAINARYTDSLTYAEVNGQHPLFDLPAGQAYIGTGIQLVHRSLDVVSPSATTSGVEPTEAGDAYAIGSQSDAALYAELTIPVLKQLEVDAALRRDHFDTYGNSTTPKIGFKFTPSDVFAFRGTYAEGFRAPNPAEASSGGTAFYLGSTNDPILCPNPATPTAPGTFPSQCSINQSGVSAANSALQPEKSKSYTFGLILEPAKWVNATVDYYDIKISDQIVPAYENPNFSAPAVRANSPFVGQAYNAQGQLVTTTASVGQFLYVNYPYINAQSTETTGVDLDLVTKFNLGTMGRIKTDLSWTHVFEYKQSVGGSSTVDLAGSHGPTGISGDTGNPKDRGQFVVTWNRGPIEVAGTVNYVGPISVTDPSTGSDLTCTSALNSASSAVYNAAAFPAGSSIPSNYCTVHSFTDFDLYTRYDWNKNVEVHVSVQNLFNTNPPVDLQTYGGPFYNPSLHQAGAVGRYFNVGASYKF